MRTISLSRCLTGIAALALCAALAACGDDDDPAPNPTDPIGPWSKTITFEDVPTDQIAGPTSYGDNLYSAAGERQVVGFTADYDSCSFSYRINEAPVWDGSGTTAELYNGGAAASRWNIRHDLDGKDKGWWQSYGNQCSVYNTESQDGANRGAGHDGSDTFLYLHGNAGSCAKISFGTEVYVRQLWVCNSAYGYGVQENGNTFAASLKDTKGNLFLLAYGYDKDGNATNGGNPLRFCLCDYAAGKPAISTWQPWDLSGLGRVAGLRFDFEGSDTGDYGLNTPADVCLDDILIEK